MYLGSGTPPQAAYVTSIMHQKLPMLAVQHLVHANAIVKELFTVPPYIPYRRPFEFENIIIETFSDASHGYESCY